LPRQFGESFRLLPAGSGAEIQGYFEDAFYKPQPRVEFARACAAFLSSGIDISDGLAGDLGHILGASGVGAVIDATAIPYSSAALQCMSVANCQLAAFFGGDDYELCVTVAPKHCAAVEAAAVAHNTRLTRIGEIVPGAELRSVDATGASKVVGAKAFQHFQRGSDQ